MNNCPKCDQLSPLIDKLISEGIPIIKENWELTTSEYKPKYPPQLSFIRFGELNRYFRPIDFVVLSTSIKFNPELHTVSSVEDHLRAVCKKELDKFQPLI